MKKREKRNLPDSIVYNHDLGIFDAFLKPYSTSVGGPKIEIENLDLFKERAVSKTNHKFTKRAEEIRDQISELLQEYSDNEMVWSSSISFEPYIGLEIYLYVKPQRETFASLISPEEWNYKFECLGRFRLDTDFSWKRIIR